MRACRGLSVGQDILAGDPALIAAAIGAMLSMLAHALLPVGPGAPVSGGPGYPDTHILDAITSLLLHGLAGPDIRRTSPPAPRQS